MSDRKSIWVMEQGEYSDYRVVGVFSSRENADAVLAAINASRQSSSYEVPTIAEWPLDPAVDDLQQGRYQHFVVMLRDGTVESVNATNEIKTYDLAGSIEICKRSAVSAVPATDKQDALKANVWATDINHAIKIVNEKRAQMIANGSW